MNITTPAVLLNWEICKANIRRMVEKANRNNLALRPHLKTAQSHHIARYLSELGVRAITTSSLSMANYFVQDGWDDITVAFPVNVREIDTINELAGKITLNLLVVNPESIDLLKSGLLNPAGIYVKIDVGTHRTGILPSDSLSIEACLKKIDSSSLMTFKGFLSHAGHSYNARSKAEIQKVHEESTGVLLSLKEKYAGQYPHLKIAPGDTPTCTVAENWKGIDEIRPGNFVFYDLMQVLIGACRLEEIAVVMACPVVAKHPDRKEVIIYGGGIHLSKDRMMWEGKEIYGLPVILHKDGWELPEKGCYVRSLSQEHGIISCSPAFYEKLEIGGLVGVLPVHSCMMVDMANEYRLTNGEVWQKM